MNSITYVKGIPTAEQELNKLGFSEVEMFLTSYSKIFHAAACETANHLLSCSRFNLSKWNTYLQDKYGISKRHAGGVIAFANGDVKSRKECSKEEIAQLTRKLKSAKKWLNSKVKLLKSSQKFYSNKKWFESKKGCLLYLACSLKYKDTNLKNLRFQIHHKKRYIHLLEQKIQHLKDKPIQVKIPHSQCFIVGSKDETCGNQICQWDGENLKFRVPYCLEDKFGKYVIFKLGDFDRKVNRLPFLGAKTWHFYYKYEKWNAAVQFTPAPVQQVSRSIHFGCIGIDLNPTSIGWARVDQDGNLKASGKIKIQPGLPKNKMDAQLVDACLQLQQLANRFACPIVVENLNFQAKKTRLREEGKKYSRMLSGWAYARFFELLSDITSNRGIKLIKVNPAYTSLIGLIKYSRLYGLGSDQSAALAIARRGMRLSERIKPGSITAYLGVKPGKHVWGQWNKLNSIVKVHRIKRHSYYSISNWESQVKEWTTATKSRRPKPSESVCDCIFKTLTA